jgi:small subunit ribosomal protein S19e
MVNFKDIPPEMIIKRLSEELSKSVKEPAWVKDVKTGEHKERGPDDDNWYFVRLASLLRKIAVMGPIGLERLSAEYGGKVDRGSRRYHSSTGSKKIIRNALQDLEKLGYVAKNKNGRSLTPAGLKKLNALSLESLNELKEKVPAIEKYA